MQVTVQTRRCLYRTASIVSFRHTNNRYMYNCFVLQGTCHSVRRIAGYWLLYSFWSNASVAQRSNFSAETRSLSHPCISCELWWLTLYLRRSIQHVTKYDKFYRRSVCPWQVGALRKRLDNDRSIGYYGEPIESHHRATQGTHLQPLRPPLPHNPQPSIGRVVGFLFFFAVSGYCSFYTSLIVIDCSKKQRSSSD